MLLSLHAHRRTRGFSLIELAVVLIVIALVAGLAIPTFQQVIQRSSERAEAASITAVGRDAVALAAFDNVSPPEPDHFQYAFDEANFGAAAAGLLADGDRQVEVRYPNEPGESDAERVFLYGDDESENAAAVISPAASHPDRCAALAVVGTVARGGVINPNDYGEDLSDSDPIEERCQPEIALKWALGPDYEAPEGPGTTDPGDDPEPEPAAPAVPTGLTGQPYSSVVDLTWDAVDELGVTYDVSRDGAEVASGLTDPLYSDEGLEPSTAYTYRVRACVEVCSEWSSEVQVTTTIAAPAAPTGFAFTNATSNAISFTWDADVAADSYEVQRQGTSAVSTTNTSYTATGLAASIGSPSTYNFRVRACNANGCSEWTSYASMTTAGYMRLDATSTASDANSSGTDWVVNVPAGVKAVFLQAAGAKGANGATCPGRQAPGTGARGANVRGVITVTPGDTLVAKVGKQGRGRFGGWPGGGNGTASSMSGYCTAMGNAGAGGGYTRWDRNGTTVLVAGGGGGGGSANHEYPTTTGGNGGAPGLANGSHGGNGADGGSGLGGLRPLGGRGGRAGGGTAAGGSAAGVTGDWISTPGGNGTAWTGGNSGNYGGGGGGGYGGGGAGGALSNPNAFHLGWGAGGGGGSSYAAAGVTGLTITQITGLDEGRACISWHGDTTCAGGSAPFVP